MSTTIYCTQCSQTFPGDYAEIDEEQILIPERYSTIIQRGLSIRLMIRNQDYNGQAAGRDAHNTFTWRSLLAAQMAHAAKQKLPSVAGDRAAFVNRGHNDGETAKDVELGRASLSYVRAIEGLRYEAELIAFSPDQILYIPHDDERRARLAQLIQQDSNPEPDKPKPRLKLVWPIQP